MVSHFSKLKTSSQEEIDLITYLIISVAHAVLKRPDVERGFPLKANPQDPAIHNKSSAVTPFWKIKKPARKKEKKKKI